MIYDVAAAAVLDLKTINHKDSWEEIMSVICIYEISCLLLFWAPVMEIDCHRLFRLGRHPSAQLPAATVSCSTPGFPLRWAFLLNLQWKAPKQATGLDTRASSTVPFQSQGAAVFPDLPLYASTPHPIPKAEPCHLMERPTRLSILRSIFPSLVNKLLELLQLEQQLPHQSRRE
ncbi:unnamed protein product [Pleuronectes platessa]|uniref:Uncharacterized protein n=1 Tax=Pleuronectes platessa TaxID=8262 RepID=A0A9N7VMM2_PLEPL|nr:unnamed protein product [Pleuronectes platessa]